MEVPPMTLKPNLIPPLLINGQWKDFQMLFFQIQKS